MDVLLLFEYPTLCGGEQSMLCLLPSLKAAGCRIKAAAPAEGPLTAALQQLGVKVFPLHLHDASLARRPLEACRVELAELLDCCRPDLLHANSLSMARLSGPVAADLGIPSVGHIRDIVRLSRRAIEDVSRQPLLLAVSEAVATFHAQQGIDRERIQVLYNGVDLELFKPGASTGYLHCELKLAPDARLLAAIGQIGPRKGLDQLLLAMRRIRVHWPDAHLLVIGQRFSTKLESVQFEQELRAEADESPLRGHVHFLGWRNDIAPLLPELTLLVHAARQEPLGRVLLEAAAVGCPVVATDVGGTREIFSRCSGSVPLEMGAVLVPPDDPVAMADGIVLLGQNPNLRGKLRDRMRKCAESFCDAKVISDRLLQHWLRAASKTAIEME